MIDAINNILATAGQEKAQAVTVNTKKTETADQQQVQASISAFGGEGWVSLTDRILILPEKIEEIAGKIVLSGEIANAGKSLHIRQSGSGWELYEITRENGGDQLLIEETFLSIKDKDFKLAYETCWKPDENGTLKPYVSRFAGFSGNGGNN